MSLLMYLSHCNVENNNFSGSYISGNVGIHDRDIGKSLCANGRNVNADNVNLRNDHIHGNVSIHNKGPIRRRNGGNVNINGQTINGNLHILHRNGRTWFTATCPHHHDNCPIPHMLMLV